LKAFRNKMAETPRGERPIKAGTQKARGHGPSRVRGKAQLDEQALFNEAMEGVTPLAHNMNDQLPSLAGPPSINAPTEEAHILQQLKALVLTGEGFIVSDTPEYREGTGYNVHPEIARRLHRGEYAIQDHVDLHGYGIDTAREAFTRFLKRALSSGKTGVLIIHGRGLSSPRQPVLKNKVLEWLNEGRWKKWVVAYASARTFDGGTGATYVLLRRTPLAKRFRKKNC
jgi:DNA-nicking Smr family endonuclease